MIATYLMPLVIIIATLLIIEVRRIEEYRKDAFFSGKMILSIILIVFLFSRAEKSGELSQLALPSVAILFVILRIIFKQKIKGMI
jgi:hypothetical protein